MLTMWGGLSSYSINRWRKRIHIVCLVAYRVPQDSRLIPTLKEKLLSVASDYHVFDPRFWRLDVDPNTLIVLCPQANNAKRLEVLLSRLITKKDTQPSDLKRIIRGGLRSCSIEKRPERVQNPNRKCSATAISQLEHKARMPWGKG